jgi:predicted hydrocarbon binding protein
MPQSLILDGDVLGFGRKGLHALRHAISIDSNPESATQLLDAGYTAGDDIYASFRRWLPSVAGVDDPAQLDAQVLGEVLSEFFRSLGWGSVSVERLGSAGLTLDSPDWAEAEPGLNASHPSCHLSAGFLANFLGQLAGGQVAVMEVECRSCNDARCRFLAGSADTLQSVYDAMAGGKDYREALLE